MALVFGLLLTADFAAASTLNYTYDAAGRLVNVNYGGSTNTVLSYDDNGNLLSQSTYVSANPDVAIAQTAAPSPAEVGVSLHYVVTVFNNNSNPATGVAVTNSLPSNATLLSFVSTVGLVVHTGNLLDWTVGQLTNGASESLIFTVRPLTVGNVTNTAIVSAATAAPDSGDKTNILVTAVLGAPGLAVGASGPNLLLSWPLPGSSTFAVEYTGSLAPPVTWSSDPSAPYIVGNQFYLTEPFTGTNRFYRLASPP